jgi:hypothetical protein
MNHELAFRDWTPANRHSSHAGAGRDGDTVSSRVMETSVPRLSTRAARAIGSLGWRAVATALALATLVAFALNPVFETPFPVLLGRTMFVAIVLLIAFAWAGQWERRWLPRWVAQVAAIVLAAPLATLAVYMLAVGGSVTAFVQHPGMRWGFTLIALSSLFVGLVLALGAMYRERDAQARSQELQFALERETLERQALDARLSLLRSQIEPHFLFNTLANVQELVESGSPRAVEVLRSLIAYLRAAMPRLKDRDATLATRRRWCAPTWS